ncbi:hypothetical protein [Paracraurococcus lichenis]|uniref:Type II toxin-antitoxin system prevent-host-death family antitoxin n=1 Tax=Paracraurococcus lichenis TaxID=3064888 RepID=A0ABT9E0B9_9PROT|nr:hypothetical protein [Paracraurococcus sp. LOR1-02]MDO9709613.1 hypothetical protein [Paracraurococcus sp. LOR1-02]
MSSHSIAEAKERVPGLIDRPLQGEPVAIARDGALSRRVAADGTAGRRRTLVVPAGPPGIDAAAVGRRMRDED